jgi:hypothetical protein
MTILPRPDERVKGVRIDADVLSVDLMDGRTIAVPIAWFPRLLAGTPRQRSNWQLAGAGYGIHWPDLDEDISTAGLLRGDAPPSIKLSKPRAKKRPADRRGSKKIANRR